MIFGEIIIFWIYKKTALIQIKAVFYLTDTKYWELVLLNTFHRQFNTTTVINVLDKHVDHLAFF